jgi:predicted metal-dependent hydrolase
MAPTHIPAPLTRHQIAQDILEKHQLLDVAPRKMSFPFSNMKEKYFFAGNSLKTCLLAGLSATFPPGEAEFIESVRNYRDKIDNPELKKQVKGFIGQEGHHSHQHKQANQALLDLGFDAPALEHKMEGIINKRVKTLNNKTRLAVTVCMEHITAILAEHVLENPEVFNGMEEPARQLMFWHAVEEIEHKAVAFDVYMECEGDRELLKKVMSFAIKIFFWRMTTFTFKLMWQNKKMPSWTEIKEFKRFLFGNVGIITQLKGPYKTFSNPDFHPWQSNSLELIDKWENEIKWDGSAAV